MNPPRPAQAVLDALVDAVGLKQLDRAGWTRHPLPRVESVAAHSWGVAYLVLVLLPPELDRGRALSYAVLHDLPEVHVGDLTPHDGVSKADKHTAECAALTRLTADLPPHLAATWHAYEAQDDPEARFVRQLDRLDMAIQALAYARTHGVDTREFVDSAARVVRHPALRALLDAIVDELARQFSSGR